MAKVIFLASPKGGAGRSATARALLVAAARSKFSVVGIDTDAQETVAKWAAKRHKAVESVPDVFSPVEVHSVKLRSLSREIAKHASSDLIVIDTAPTVEEAMTDVLTQARNADLVLVPTSCSADDLDSILPWYARLRERGVNAEIVLNKVNRSSKAFNAARNRLVQLVELVPVEIPLYEDIATTLGKGLTSLDIAKMRGSDELAGLWGHVRRRLAI